LDPTAASDIVDLFRRLHLEGATIIFATHNYHLLEKVPGKRVKMKNGAVTE
jgi:ABC-type ATPase involved in cell division